MPRSSRGDPPEAAGTTTREAVIGEQGIRFGSGFNRSASRANCYLLPAGPGRRDTRAPRFLLRAANYARINEP